MLAECPWLAACGGSGRPVPTRRYTAMPIDRCGSTHPIVTIQIESRPRSEVS